MYVFGKTLPVLIILFPIFILIKTLFLKKFVRTPLTKNSNIKTKIKNQVSANSLSFSMSLYSVSCLRAKCKRNGTCKILLEDKWQKN